MCTILINLFLALLGLHCCLGFSLGAERRGSSLAAQASHCSGFSYREVWALGHKGFSSCSMWAQQLKLLGFRAQV